MTPVEQPGCSSPTTMGTYHIITPGGDGSIFSYGRRRGTTMISILSGSDDTDPPTYDPATNGGCMCSTAVLRADLCSLNPGAHRASFSLPNASSLTSFGPYRLGRI